MRATWFKKTGDCCWPKGCTRKASGRLMSERNEDMGPYCDKHARSAIDQQAPDYKER